jgi:hypothetical protein
VLHIHNGDVTAALARRANIPGRHVPFREILVAGPVPANLATHDWIERRARFLAENYDQNLLRVRNELLDQETMIDEARQEDEVVLWFEHDLFCLMNFIYLLGRLSKVKNLTTVWCASPLGTTDEEQISTFFLSRSAVPPQMHRIAADAWSAFTADDPLELNKYLLNPVRDFAFLNEGVRLHASRFPSTRNGLGEVERRAMEAIAAGATNFVALFTRFDEHPPRFGFGDGEFLRDLRRLAACAIPMITISEIEGEQPPKALFALTPAGQNVLDGKDDFIELNNAGFWLGGAYLTRERLWRWDAARGEIVWSGAVH